MRDFKEYPVWFFSQKSRRRARRPPIACGETYPRVASSTLASTTPWIEKVLSSVMAPSSLQCFLMKASRAGKKSFM